MAQVKKLIIGEVNFTENACGFPFVASVCELGDDTIDETNIRVVRLLAIYPGTKVILVDDEDEEKKEEPKKAEPEKGREAPPSKIAHVRMDDLGGGNWAAIPVDVNGEDRECLVADGGGVIMSHDGAMTLAVEHAASLGVEVKEPAGDPEKKSEGDPDEKPEPISLEVTGRAHPDDEPKADAEPIKSDAPDASAVPVVEPSDDLSATLDAAKDGDSMVIAEGDHKLADKVDAGDKTDGEKAPADEKPVEPKADATKKGKKA